VPAGWKTFTTPDGTLAFDYPGSWTVRDSAAEPTGDPGSEPTGDPGAEPTEDPAAEPTEDPAAEPTGDPAAEPAGGGVSVELVSDNGKTMATLRTNVVAGAECPEKIPFMVYDSEPLPALAQGGVAPRFVYEGRTDPASTDPAESLTLAYGITSAPEPTGATACPISHFFTWPPNAAVFGGVYDPFSTTPGGPPLVDTPEVYKDTTEYKDVKQAITSLRPVGKP
jgi:hypothetical protein